MRTKRTIVCGRVTEQQIFHKPAQPAKKRAKKRKGATSPAHRARNQRNKVRKLARIINANFTRESYAIVLTYTVEPKDLNQAEANRKEFMRKMNRIALKHGNRPRLVTVVSVRDGKTGDEVRFHIHMLADSVGFVHEDDKLFFFGKNIEEIWTYGMIKVERFYNVYDHTGLAMYLLEQAHDGKYHASRGMLKPTVIDKYALGTDVLTAPPGDYVIDKSDNDEYDYHYLRSVDVSTRHDPKKDEL